MKALISTLFLSLTTTFAGAPLLFDSFDTSSILVGSTPMVGNTWQSAGGAGFIMTGNAVFMSALVTQKADSLFAAEPGVTLYGGFTLNVTSAPTTSSMMPLTFLGSNAGGGNQVGRVFISPGTSSGFYKIGIDNNLDNPVWWPGELQANTEYRIVVAFKENGNADITTLWVDPAGIHSPSVSEAAENITGEIYGIRLNAANHSNGTLSLDNLIVTADFSAAVDAGLYALSFQSPTGSITEGRSKEFYVTPIAMLTEPVGLSFIVESDDPSILPSVYVTPESTIFPGQTTFSVYCSAVADKILNPPRSFWIRMQSPSHPDLKIGPCDVMTVTLVDDEIPGTVYFERDRAELLEEEGSLQLKLKRYENDTGELSLRVRTVDGTALAGRDYQAVDTVVTFPDGILEKTITIGGPVASEESHPPRKFSVELSDPAAGTVIGSPGTCTVTVNDKDDPGSTALRYSVPNPETLARIVDLALDANGALYALALNSLDTPSAFESRIIKFASDGTGQLLAVVPTGSVYRWANDIEIASDGKIYVAGGPVIRFHPDGVRDTTWSSPPLSGIDSFARVLPLPDGKVLVSGNIVNSVGGYTRLKVLRLNSNGTVDPAFNLGSIVPSSGTSWIYDMALDAEGRILIAGGFSSVQGKPQSKVARLSKDGVLDESFKADALATSYVHRVFLAPEGKIFAVSEGYTTRLLSNGSRDQTFTPIRATTANLQPDGKLAVCDAVNSSFRRYDGSGQLDQAFVPSGYFPSESLLRILVGPDGLIHASGRFVEADGRAVPMIATLNGGEGAAGGVIEWDTSQATVGEGIGRPGVMLRRSGSISGSVGVHYDLVPESAGVGFDVAQLSGFHRFGPGESEHLVELDILDDSRVEQTDSFRVVLHNPAGGALVGPRSNLTFQIIDDDGTSLGDWLARFFPTTPLDRALLGLDSDKDGVANLVEWMTDSHPSQSGDEKFSQAGSFQDGSTDFLGVSFYVNANKADVQTFVERTSRLNPPAWEIIWDSKLDPDWQSNLIQSFPADGVGWMSIRSPYSGQNSEFFRIRYSSPP